MYWPPILLTLVAFCSQTSSHNYYYYNLVKLTPSDPCAHLKSPYYGYYRYPSYLRKRYYVKPASECPGPVKIGVVKMDVSSRSGDSLSECLDRYGRGDVVRVLQGGGDDDYREYRCGRFNESHWLPNATNEATIEVLFWTDGVDNYHRGFKLIFCATGCNKPTTTTEATTTTTTTTTTTEAIQTFVVGNVENVTLNADMPCVRITSPNYPMPYEENFDGITVRLNGYRGFWLQISCTSNSLTVTSFWLDIITTCI